MKLRRMLSGLVFGLGCAITFVGVMAFALPRVDNAQLQLVLQSFESPSRFALVNLISSGMRFALRESLKVLLFGAICLSLGGYLFCRFTETEKPAAPAGKPCETPDALPPAPVSEAPNPFAIPEPVSLPEEYTFAPSSAQPESAIASVMTGHKPLLEENKIDESAPWLPERFEAESRAMETETGESSPSGSRMILRAPQLTPEPPASTPLQSDTPAPSEPEKEEAVPPSPLLKPAPSRIRSTMGKHKQW